MSVLRIMLGKPWAARLADEKATTRLTQPEIMAVAKRLDEAEMELRRHVSKSEFMAFWWLCKERGEPNDSQIRERLSGVLPEALLSRL